MRTDWENSYWLKWTSSWKPNFSSLRHSGAEFYTHYYYTLQSQNQRHQLKMHKIPMKLFAAQSFASTGLGKRPRLERKYKIYLPIMNKTFFVSPATSWQQNNNKMYTKSNNIIKHQLRSLKTSWKNTKFLICKIQEKNYYTSTLWSIALHFTTGSCRIAVNICSIWFSWLN